MVLAPDGIEAIPLGTSPVVVVGRHLLPQQAGLFGRQIAGVMRRLQAVQLPPDDRQPLAMEGQRLAGHPADVPLLGAVNLPALFVAPMQGPMPLMAPEIDGAGRDVLLL